MVTFYQADRVGTLYTPDVSTVTADAKRLKAQPATQDTIKTVLLLIDAQVDFIHEDGALSVPGAIDDTRRTIEWMIDHAHHLTTVIASLDSHLPNQIFSPSWWYDQEAQHPAPFTIITYSDVQSGRWQPRYHAAWSVEYVRRLEENAKKQLMIWHYHTLIGTVGHAITPALYEAILYHATARQAQPRFIMKGMIPQVEHYSIFEPEVKSHDLPATARNDDLLEELGSYDKIYIAGQAKSHCVLESVTSMVKYFEDQPDVLRKIHLLTDAMSSVYSPDIDFDRIADDTFAKYAARGINLSTTDAI